MKIYVVGSSKNKFLPLNNIREKFLIDQKHEGDNIDFLNPWYCELTGLYYLWKNVDDDIVGLEHYRRYFVNDKGKLLSEGEIREILKDHDAICKKWVFAEHKEKNGFSFLKKSKRFSYYQKFLSFLPKEESDFITKELQTLPYFAQCNMSICKKEIIDKYMGWFMNYAMNFNAKEIYISPRIMGYISEFIFGAWIKMNKYKIHYQKTNVFNQSLSKIIRNG